jgi:hypothetical protein
MRYRWEQKDSLIRQAEFHKGRTQREAVLQASEGAEPERLRNLALALKSEGLTVIPDTQGECAVLRVEGVGGEDALLLALARADAVRGEAKAEMTEEEAKKPDTLVTQIKNNAVTAAGYTYLLGDALMILAGLVRQKGITDAGGAAETLTGMMWAAPNLGLALFGKRDPEMETALLFRRVKEYLDAQGIEIPHEDALTMEHLARKEGPLSRIVEFLHEYPIEINNSVEALGGVSLMHAGYKQCIGWKEENRNYYKMAAGAAVVTGMGSSVLLKEKKPGENAEAGGRGARDDRNIFRRTLDWFTEKPLRLAGWLPFLNNVFTLIGANLWERPRVKNFLDVEYSEKKKEFSKIRDEAVAKLAKAEIKNDERKTLLNKITSSEGDLNKLETKKIKAENYGKAAHINTAQCVTFMLANALYSFGSKEAGADIKAMGGLDQVYALLGHVIAAQPKEHQGAIVNRVAGFLAAQKDVPDNAAQVAEALIRKVRGFAESPWTARAAAREAAAVAIS